MDKNVHEMSPKNVHGKSPSKNVHEMSPILIKSVHEMSLSTKCLHPVFEIHVEKDFFGTVVNLFTGSSGGSNGGGGGVGDLIAHPHSILQQSCNNSAAAAAAAQAAAACAAQAAAQCHDRLKLFKT